MEVRTLPESDDIAIMAASLSTRTLVPINSRVAEGPAPSPGRGRWLLLGLCVLFGVYVGWLLVDPSSAKWLYNVLLVGSAFVCLSSPLRRTRERAAWTLPRHHPAPLGGGRLLLHDLPLGCRPPAPPTVTDWLWLASYPFLYASIALLVRARTAHFERSLWLDAILAALAVAASGAAVLFGAVVESTGGSPLIAAMNIAYPLADALLLGIVVAVLALTGWRLDRTWALHRRRARRPRSRRQRLPLPGRCPAQRRLAILDAGWPLAMLLLAAAAWQPVASSSARSGSRALGCWRCRRSSG